MGGLRRKISLIYIVSFIAVGVFLSTAGASYASDDAKSAVSGNSWYWFLGQKLQDSADEKTQDDDEEKDGKDGLKIISVTKDNVIDVTVQNIPEPVITEVDGEHQVVIEGIDTIGQPGEPKLPVKGVNVLIPAGKVLKDAEVALGEKVTMPGKYIVKPGQEPIPLSYKGPIEKTPPKDEIYNSKEPFPKEKKNMITIQRMCGYEIAVFTLHPAEYIPAEGKLSYYKDISLKVNLESKEESVPKEGAEEGAESENKIPGESEHTQTEEPRVRDVPEDRERVARIISNPQDFSSYDALLQGGKGASGIGAMQPLTKSGGGNLGGSGTVQPLTQGGAEMLGDFDDLPRGTIEGKVYGIGTTGPTPLANVRVELKISSPYEGLGHVAYASTGRERDENGKYKFPKVVMSTSTQTGDGDVTISWLRYRVCVTLDGYKDYISDELFFTDEENTIKHDIELEPKTASGDDDSGDGNSGGGSSGGGTPGIAEYLIITNKELADFRGPENFDDLKDLCDEKEARGIRTKIVTTDDISTGYSGEDLAEKIRECIKYAYNNFGTKYVLLVGDGGGNPSNRVIIPAAKLHDSGEDIPSDLYYACLDGSMDDNKNKSEKGYFRKDEVHLSADEIDLLAEVYIGRAPVVTTTELSNFVRKTLAYKYGFSSVLTTYQAGEWLGFGGIAEYAWPAMEEVRNGSSAHGYTTKGFEEFKFLDNRVLYEADVAEDYYGCRKRWSPEEMMKIINDGVHIINHDGHANESTVMKLSTRQADWLINKDYFFGYSQGCDPGAFDYDCIGEHLIKNPTGAFAVIYNSRSGWGEGYSTAGSSQYFARQFWDAVFGEHIFRLGPANESSKHDNLWNIYYERNRWCYLDLNLLGDPELAFMFAPKNGFVGFSKSRYTARSKAEIILFDSQITADKVTVKVASLTDTSLVELKQIPEGVSIFKGSIQLQLEPSGQGDNAIQVSEYDRITAYYYEDSPDEVNTATAIVDGLGPIITAGPSISSNEVSLDMGGSVIITWRTNESSFSKVYYGRTPLLGLEAAGGAYDTSHKLKISELEANTTYYFAVESEDLAGNSTYDSNKGNLYKFVIHGPKIELEPPSLHFEVLEHSTEPVTKRFKIKNAAGVAADLLFYIPQLNRLVAELACEQEEGVAKDMFVDWITGSPYWDNVPPAGSVKEVEVTINPQGLKRGNYKEEMVIKTNVTNQKEIKFVIEVEVGSGPAVHLKQYNVKDTWSGSGMRFMVNGDRRLNPGERVELTISVENVGNAAALGLSATLSTHQDESYIRILEDTINWGNIPAGGREELRSFVIDVRENAPPGYLIPFTLEITDFDGHLWREEFNMTVAEDRWSELRISEDMKISKDINHVFKSEPRIACDDDGGVYIVWYDNRYDIVKEEDEYRTTHYDIFFNYSRNYGDDWQVEDIQINADEPGTTISTKPRISCDNRGNIYVIWMSKNEPSGNNKLYFRSSHDYGKTWEKVVELDASLASAGDASGARIVCDENGRVYVTWCNGLNGTEYIYFNHSENYGEGWQGAQRLDRVEPKEGKSFEPRIACDNYGGVYVAWLDTRDGSWNRALGDIYFNYSHDGGRTWQAEDIRINKSGNASAANPQLTCDNDGKVYIVWQDGENNDDESKDVIASPEPRRGEATEDEMSEEVLSPSGRGQSQPSGIYLNYSDDYGRSWQNSDIKISGDNQNNSHSPQLDCDKNGNVYVTWVNEGDVYFNCSHDSGARWLDDYGKDIILLGGGGDAQSLKISSNDYGNVYVMWNGSFHPVNEGDIYLNYSQDFGNTWQDEAIPVNHTSSIFYPSQIKPQIASDNNGNLYSVWPNRVVISSADLSYYGLRFNAILVPPQLEFRVGAKRPEDNPADSFFALKDGDAVVGSFWLVREGETLEIPIMAKTYRDERPELFADTKELPENLRDNIQSASFATDFDEASRETRGAFTWTPGAGMAGEYYPLVIGVEDGSGRCEFQTIKIVVLPSSRKPFFTAVPVKGNPPLKVHFKDLTGGDVSNRVWRFGDGATSTEQNPVHTYNEGGIYTVELEVPGHGTETREEYITVYSIGEIIPDFTADQRKGLLPHRVQFKNLTRGPAVKFLWDFGVKDEDENIVVETQSNKYEPYFFYWRGGIGKFTVSLTAYGPDGKEVTVIKEDFIEVCDGAVPYPGPEIDFTGSPTYGTASLDVSFAGKCKEKILNVEWDFNGDGIVDLSGQDSGYLTSNYTYSYPGEYTVTLTVMGYGGSSSVSRKDYITVVSSSTGSDSPVKADFEVAAGYPRSMPPGTPVKFADKSRGDIESWEWDFGDGGKSDEREPTHTYETADTYTVRLTVRGGGGSDYKEIENCITVLPSEGPIAYFKAEPREVRSGVEVQFTDQSAPEDNIAKWEWNFGDPASGEYNTSTEKKPTHKYYATRFYSVVLTVTDKQGRRSQPCVRENYINITDKSDHPIRADSQIVTLDEDGFKDIKLSATFPNNNYTLAYEVITYPSNGKITGEGPNLRYIPKADYFGEDSFTFKATLNIREGIYNSNEAKVTIKINPVNDPPRVSPMPNQFKEPGATFDDINLDDYVEDVDNLDSAITWTITGAKNLDTTREGNLVTIKPIDRSWTGFETITFTASDGSSTSATAATFGISNKSAGDITAVQERINNARPGEVIVIEPAIYVFSQDLYVTNDITLKAKDPNPDNTVFILGNNHINVRYGWSRAINNVTIDGITITGHKGVDGNGPIQNYAVRLTIRNCKIIGNDGIKVSAIYTSPRSELYISNTLIANNRNLMAQDIQKYGFRWGNDYYCGTIYLGGFAKLYVEKSIIANNAAYLDSFTVQTWDEETGYGEEEVGVRYGAIHSSYFNHVEITDSILWNNGDGIEPRDISSMYEKWQRRDIIDSDIQQTGINSRGSSDVIHEDPELDDDYNPQNPNCDGMGADFSSRPGPTPDAHFTGSPQEGIAPLTVSFTGESDDEILSWEWDFGDGQTGYGQTGYGQTVSHTYTRPGEFTVSLKVTGPGSSSYTAVKDNYIKVTSDNLGAVRGAVSAGRDIPLGSAIITLKPHIYGGGARDYTTLTGRDGRYRFGDVLKYMSGGSGDASKTWLRYKIYISKAGYEDYVGSREIIFNDGIELFEYPNVTLKVKPPQASFAASPAEGEAPLTVHFTDKSIGVINSWTWTFGDSQTGYGKNVSHTYNYAGTYTARLEVKGPGGEDEAEAGINVIAGGRIYRVYSNDAIFRRGDALILYAEVTNGAFTSYGWLCDGDEFISGRVPQSRLDKVTISDSIYIEDYSSYFSPGEHQIKFRVSNDKVNLFSEPFAIYVVKDGGIIQKAINSAKEIRPGHYLAEIEPGVYELTSDIEITKNITLASEDPLNTIIELGRHHILIKDPKHQYSARSPYSQNLTDVTIDGVTVTGYRYYQTGYGEEETIYEKDYRRDAPIQNYAANLTLRNCRIIDNIGMKISAVYTYYYSKLYLENTLIAQNRNYISPEEVLPDELVSGRGYYCGSIYLDGYAECYIEDSTIANNYNYQPSFYIETGYGDQLVKVNYGTIQRDMANHLEITSSIMWSNGKYSSQADISYRDPQRQSWAISYSAIKQESVYGNGYFINVIRDVEPEFTDPKNYNYTPRNEAFDNMGARFDN